jgi:hypothetical protein
MTEFSKRHARKYSDRAGLTSTEAPVWFSSTPTLTGLFSEESGGKSSKFHPKSYKQPKNNKVSRRKKEKYSQ